jgi:Flp pilus assembly protein TadB
VFALCLGFSKFKEQSRRSDSIKPDITKRFARLWESIAPRKAWLIGAAAAGLATIAFTGWLVFGLVVTVAITIIPLVMSDPQDTEVLWLAALDRWLRAVIASIATGKSINEALKGTAKQAPEPLAGSVALLALRLRQRWSLDDALSTFAIECANAEVDAVAAALLVAGSRGGGGAGATLEALADSIQDRLAGARDTATERAKPRVVVRQITGITVAVVAFSAFTNPSYFDPYRSGVGNLLLLALVAMYMFALLKLRSMSIAQPRMRVLAVGRTDVNGSNVNVMRGEQ